MVGASQATDRPTGASASSLRKATPTDQGETTTVALEPPTSTGRLSDQQRNTPKDHPPDTDSVIREGPVDQGRRPLEPWVISGSRSGGRHKVPIWPATR